jgi:arylsulfatase A-like enzyme
VGSGFGQAEVFCRRLINRCDTINAMTSRRAFLKTIAAAPALTAQSPKENRPNIIMLSVDDMNDWVNCLGGYEGVKTPNIDRLAKRGVLFKNAHCSSPLCNPSRTALFTGLRASTSGVYNNEHWWRPALPDAITIPQYFRKHGYTAVGAGKVFHHNAGYNPPDQWDDFQLQEFDDPWYRRPEWYPWNKKVPNPPGHPFNGIQNIQGEFDWGVLPKPEAAYGDMKAIEYGKKFLGQKHDKPFLLCVGLWHPHIPLFAPKTYFDLYKDRDIRLPVNPEDDLDDVPEIGRKLAAARREEHETIVREGKWKDAIHAYLACISFADHMIGMMLDALDSSQYAKNTIIVFWSDNGWHLGEKIHWHKSTLWQRSTHVPLIFAGPGMRGANTPRNQPVTLLDLYPTLVDLAGLPKNSTNEGLSLRPLLENPKAPRQPAVITFLKGNHAVRDERWRYIRYNDGTEELYDEHADPRDFHNLASKPEHAALKKNFQQWLPKINVDPVPERSAYDFDFATHTWKKKSQ